MYRIHIVGSAPRTGTTLLTQMMISGFDIDLHTTTEDRIATPPPRNGRVYLTKSPKDILVVKPILELVKKLYVIYLLRDPRDMIVSKHGLNKDQYWGDLRYWHAFTPFGRELENHPRFVTIRYEDLVTKPDEIQKLIADKLPFLQQKDLFSNFHKVSTASSLFVKALNGVRAPDTKSVGNWRNHKPRVLSQINLHGSISDDLIKYGYEPDDSWEAELENITPEYSESQESPFFTPEFIRKKQKFKHIRALRVWLMHTQALILIQELQFRVFGRRKRAEEPRLK